ncbi:protein of unknown function (plasmid) [Azospirillum baldaniorum]|uniref:MmgE/PrpD N-terminal domain-containing protein n=1 Tax=Azospirillum baldaniorum TaxID=1064539 RepID=A0A9P1JU35_9PROT|nr:protein of unknown function [Azospirillum baldaniorum]
MTSLSFDVKPASQLLAAARPSWLDRCGTFAAGLTVADLPAPVVERAKLVLLDCVGVIAAGMQEPECQALAARLAETGGSGDCPAIGSGRGFATGSAAFLNGLAGTMLELDEGNQYARGHPAIHVVPALLAAGPRVKASGADLLTALALGYEIGSRIGIAAKLLVTTHPHGTWGTAGAALGRRPPEPRRRGVDDRDAQHRLDPRPRHQPADDAGGRHGAQRLCRGVEPARPDRLGSGGERHHRRDRRGGQRVRRRHRHRLPAGADGGGAGRALGDRPQLLQAPRRLPLHPRRARRAGRHRGASRRADRPGGGRGHRGRHLRVGRPARRGRAEEHAGGEILAALRAGDLPRQRRRHPRGLPRRRPPGRGDPRACPPGDRARGPRPDRPPSRPAPGPRPPDPGRRPALRGRGADQQGRHRGPLQPGGGARQVRRPRRSGLGCCPRRRHCRLRRVDRPRGRPFNPDPASVGARRRRGSV